MARKFIRYRTIMYNGTSIDVIESEYVYGHRKELQAIEHKSGEPYAVLTVNIPSSEKEFPDVNQIILDCNNCPGIDKALSKAGLIGECIGRVQSGYFTYPVYEYLGF